MFNLWGRFLEYGIRWMKHPNRWFQFPQLLRDIDIQEDISCACTEYGEARHMQKFGQSRHATCDMRRCCPKYIIYRGRTDRMHWADINKRIQKVMLRVANLPKMSFVSGYVGDVWALFQRPLYRMIHRIQEESMLPFLGKNRWKQTWPTGIWVTPTDLIPSGGI